VCRCQKGYDGNPYLSDEGGCQGTHVVTLHRHAPHRRLVQCCAVVLLAHRLCNIRYACLLHSSDINECALPGNCVGICTNTDGTYECRCPRGAAGNPYVEHGCVKSSLGEQSATRSDIVLLCFCIAILLDRFLCFNKCLHGTRTNCILPLLCHNSKPNMSSP
jgi:hypothetical protein